MQAYAALYLLVFAGLWIAALPEHFRAENGVTAAGDPVGDPPFTALCFVIAIGALTSTFVVRRGRPDVAPVTLERAGS